LLVREQRHCGKFETAEASALSIRQILDVIHHMIAQHKGETERLANDPIANETIRSLTELQVHHCILLLVHLASTGEFATANLCLPALFELHASISSMTPDPSSCYGWLPADVKEVLLFYISCICNRANGKLNQSIDYATGALNLVNGMWIARLEQALRTSRTTNKCVEHMTECHLPRRLSEGCARKSYVTAAVVQQPTWLGDVAL
jgi:hypothetical protein